MVELAVNDRVGLAVLAVQILGDVDGVLVAATAERAPPVVGLDGVGALCAVAGVALKGLHHEVFVGVELPHHHDGLGAVYGGGHGVGAPTTEDGRKCPAREESLSKGRGEGEGGTSRVERGGPVGRQRDGVRE